MRKNRWESRDLRVTRKTELDFKKQNKTKIIVKHDDENKKFIYLSVLSECSVFPVWCGSYLMWDYPARVFPLAWALGRVVRHRLAAVRSAEIDKSCSRFAAATAATAANLGSASDVRLNFMSTRERRNLCIWFIFITKNNNNNNKRSIKTWMLSRDSCFFSALLSLNYFFLYFLGSKINK